MSKTIPVLIAGAVGWLMIVAYFSPYLLPSRQIAEEWYTIVAAIAMVLGAVNLCAHHLKKISKNEAGWGYSAVTLLAFSGTVIIGILKVNVVPESARHIDRAWSGPFRQEGSAFWWIYEFLFSPVVSTMFALLAFYVSSAAFRAFRAKNLEAILLLSTALIVLIGQTTDREILTLIWPSFTKPSDPGSSGPFVNFVSYSPIADITEFIRKTFVTAGQRAIMIGIALGVVATSLRVLLGLDRAYLGGDE